LRHFLVTDRIIRRGLSPSARAHEIRRCTAVVFAFITLQRVSTSAKVEERDIGVDSTHLWFRVRFEKGRERRKRDVADIRMRVIRMPLSAPGVARVAELAAGCGHTFRRVLRLTWRAPPHRDVRRRHRPK